MDTVSITEIIQRAQRGDQLNAVFFGGSLTWGANASDPNRTSWRALTMRMLKQKYPQARWNFFDASIGGTGSGLGVFRLERDVLSCDPDLVIIDFTLNDQLKGTADGFYDWNNQSYEKILRECLAHRSAVLPVFLTSQEHTGSTDISVYKRRLEHIELFKKYNLEYADVLGIMNKKFKEGKLDTAKLWPPELFDTTHPHDAGYAEYTKCFTEEWERIEKTQIPQPAYPAQPLTGNHFTHISRIELAEAPPAGWKVDYPCIVADSYDWMASRWIDKVITFANAEQTGACAWQSRGQKQLEPFSFTFRAERIGLMMETLPESVKFSASIDDAPPAEIVFRSVKRSQFHIVTLGTDLDPEKEHKITIYPEIPQQNVPGVMRWGCLLLNGCKPTNLTWE